MDEIQRESVTLSWKPPADDGGSPITGYLVEKRDKKKNSWMTVERVTKDTLVVTAKKLIEGTEYNFRVKADNKAGLGEPVELEKPVTPKSPFGKADNSELYRKNVLVFS